MCGDWGPGLVISLFGYRYFVIFVTDYSRAIWNYLLKSKNEVLLIFQFYKLVETQFDTKLKVFYTDNGGEYMSHAFSSYLF